MAPMGRTCTEIRLRWALGVDEADLGVVIEGGRGVGHAADGGESAGDGGGAAGGDGFLGFLAGLAEVDVDVDQVRG